jgi:hypothetical protein
MHPCQRMPWQLLQLRHESELCLHRPLQAMLGIGAAMLGACHVVGIDVDADALEVAQANVAEYEDDLPVCSPAAGPSLGLIVCLHRLPALQLLAGLHFIGFTGRLKNSAASAGMVCGRVCKCGDCTWRCLASCASLGETPVSEVRWGELGEGRPLLGDLYLQCCIFWLPTCKAALKKHRRLIDCSDLCHGCR